MSSGLAGRSALAIAAVRVLLGIVAVASPGLVLRPWVGTEAETAPGKTLGRALGGRDLALGVGALLAARRGRPIRGWVEAGALADGVDTLATALGFRALPARSRWLLVASSGGTAAAGLLLGRSL